MVHHQAVEEAKVDLQEEAKVKECHQEVAEECLQVECHQAEECHQVECLQAEDHHQIWDHRAGHLKDKDRQVAWLVSRHQVANQAPAIYLATRTH